MTFGGPQALLPSWAPSPVKIIEYYILQQCCYNDNRIWAGLHSLFLLILEEVKYFHRSLNRLWALGIVSPMSNEVSSMRYNLRITYTEYSACILRL